MNNSIKINQVTYSIHREYSGATPVTTLIADMIMRHSDHNVPLTKKEVSPYNGDCGSIMFQEAT